MQVTEVESEEARSSRGVAAKGAERMCPGPAADLQLALSAACGLVMARMVERQLE